MDCQTQLVSMAIEELDKGDHLMATKILTTGIRITPDNPDLYFERSICYHKLGDYQASLNDANAAIRLNSADYNIHYQKGLALLGLSMFSEAVISFKKAIELRARQDDSKLSDIFNLLRDAMNEFKTARRRPGLPNSQTQRGDSGPASNIQTNTALVSGQGVSSDSVDSTTDRPVIQPGPSSNHQGITSIGSLMANGNNLVSANRNIQPVPNLSQGLNTNLSINRVSSSAGHVNNHHLAPQINNLSPENSVPNLNGQKIKADHLIGNTSSELMDPSKSAQYEWNIRRSERIFLHANDSPGPSPPQFEIITRLNEQPNMVVQQRQKTTSNTSSINSGRGAKRQLENDEQQLYQQPAKLNVSKDGPSSVAGSDIDVDDSNNPCLANESSNNNELANDNMRVMITPSSSMPATSQGPSTSTSKDDSYSSKYKRLRRDRERARRGTSKLCTIRPSDLEELHKHCDSSKRFMRVIAPIDGWLYSGQLSIDDNSGKSNNASPPQYVVKLDGDATGSSYLFSQETVLNDVIKEVRVKSVSELRKGARICCYWSRQYKCLSTGVVTSRTFEATKSLVSVKYDNGDLSALPLEDLRLLPPDYPKYMSNCDPLLLASNGHENRASTMCSASQSNTNRVKVDFKFPMMEPESSNNTYIVKSSCVSGGDKISAEKSQATYENTVTEQDHQRVIEIQQEAYIDNDHDTKEDEHDEQEFTRDNEATIPPTDKIIDFITSENTLHQQDENQHSSPEPVERVSITKDNITITEDTQLESANNSRASSEENNCRVLYLPWKFDGPPRRSKRHGRTYRDNYSSIRRGNEVINVGDSAELMPRDESILPFIAKIDGFWATGRGEMRVRVRWYYRLAETEGEPYELRDGDNALFETDHLDENDVQSIYRSSKILSWADYSKNNLGHTNANNNDAPKIFYLAGYYDPVRRVKHLRSDVKETQ